jgi:hypothetical protein
VVYARGVAHVTLTRAGTWRKEPHPILKESDFTANIAKGLGQWKSEEEIWGDITHAMRHVLKEMLEGLLEAERDLLVACDRANSPTQLAAPEQLFHIM